MRFVRYLMVSLMLFAVLTVSAKGSFKQNVYMFGFSASFNDSIVYFTPVQQVEGYISNDRNHFLVNRSQYSYQLRNYFDNRGQLHRTCITVYSTDKEKADKKYEKLKEKYTTKSKNKFDVVYLSDDDFKFQSVAPDEGTVYVDAAEAEKAAEKTAEQKNERHKKGPKK